MDFQIVDVVPAYSERAVVYIAEFGDVTKVGVSVNPRQRLSALAGSSGRKCGRVAIGGGSDAFANERLILNAMSESRLNGSEYVSLSLEEVLLRVAAIPEAPWKALASETSDPTRFDGFIDQLFGDTLARRDEVFYDFLRSHGPMLITMGQSFALKDLARNQSNITFAEWVEGAALTTAELYLDDVQAKYRDALVESYIAALKAKVAEMRAA